jgi:galactokinase
LLGGSGRFLGVRNHQVGEGFGGCTIHSVIVRSTSSAHASLTHDQPERQRFRRSS